MAKSARRNARESISTRNIRPNRNLGRKRSTNDESISQDRVQHRSRGRDHVQMREKTLPSDQGDSLDLGQSRGPDHQKKMTIMMMSNTRRRISSRWRRRRNLRRLLTWEQIPKARLILVFKKFLKEELQKLKNRRVLTELEAVSMLVQSL